MNYFHEADNGVFENLIAIHENFVRGGIQDLFGLPFSMWPAAARVFYIKFLSKPTIRM